MTWTGRETSKDGLPTPVVVVLVALILLAGFITSVCVSKATEKPTARQDFLWLMTFTAAISWWVASVFPDGRGDGQPISISTWSALFAVYESKSYRIVRDSKMQLFVSSLAGLIVAMLFGWWSMGGSGPG